MNNIIKSFITWLRKNSVNFNHITYGTIITWFIMMISVHYNIPIIGAWVSIIVSGTIAIAWEKYNKKIFKSKFMLNDIINTLIGTFIGLSFMQMANPSIFNLQ